RRSTGMKSMVPAMRVLRPSVGNRVMTRMPDSPAVSFCQFSALPTPSDVMMPMPVTTTWRQVCSRLGVMRFTFVDCFDQRQPLAAPMADAGDDHLRRRSIHRTFETGRVEGRKDLSARQRDRCESDIHHELRLDPVAEMGAGR